MVDYVISPDGSGPGETSIADALTGIFNGTTVLQDTDTLQFKQGNYSMGNNQLTIRGNNNASDDVVYIDFPDDGIYTFDFTERTGANEEALQIRLFPQGIKFRRPQNVNNVLYIKGANESVTGLNLQIVVAECDTYSPKFVIYGFGKAIESESSLDTTLRLKDAIISASLYLFEWKYVGSEPTPLQFDNCIFTAGSTVGLIRDTGYEIQINNSILCLHDTDSFFNHAATPTGNMLTINNSVIMPGKAGAGGTWDMPTTLNNCIWYYNMNDPQDGLNLPSDRVTGALTENNTIHTTSINSFIGITPPRASLAAFFYMNDDSYGWNAWADICKLAESINPEMKGIVIPLNYIGSLEPGTARYLDSGLHVGGEQQDLIFEENNIDGYVGFWSTIKAFSGKGYSVCAHTANDFELGADDPTAFTIDGDTNMTMEIVGGGSGTITIKDNSVALTNWNQRPLTDFNWVSDLRDALNDETGITCGTVTTGTEGDPRSLKDFSEASIATVTNIDYGNDNILRWEVKECFDIIERQTGKTANVLIYPGGQFTDAKKPGLYNNAARLAFTTGGSSVHPEKWQGKNGIGLGGEMFEIARYKIDDFFDVTFTPNDITGTATEPVRPTDDTQKANMKNQAKQFMEYLMWSGATGAFYGHWKLEYDDGHGYSLEETLRPILEAVSESGIRCPNINDHATLLHDNVSRTDLTANTGLLEIDYGLIEAQWLLVNDVQPSENWQGIDAGTKYWTGSNPVGMDGEPFSDRETSIGIAQSKDTPFHPTKL